MHPKSTLKNGLNSSARLRFGAVRSTLMLSSGFKKRSFFWLLAIGVITVAQIFTLDIVEAKSEPFEVRSATTELRDGVYFASARINYRLSEEALDALQNGIALNIQLQIEVSRVRRFWPDQKSAALKQDYQLSYQPLSERYVVKNLNSGVQSSFATLFSALSNMGRVTELPVIDATLLEPGAKYEFSIRAVLDQNTLPRPLRLIAFWSDGFRLESDWYTWKPNR